MKKLLSLSLALGLLVTLVSVTSAAPDNGPKTGCTTIQSGELLTSDSSAITTGYDEWGYNLSLIHI